MTCREFADFVMDYFDGQLADVTRARFDEHLTLCPDCETDLDVEEDEVDEGEIVSCPECGSDFEVVSTHPLDLTKVADEDEEEEKAEAEDGDA